MGRRGRGKEDRHWDEKIYEERDAGIQMERGKGGCVRGAREVEKGRGREGEEH